MVVLCLGSIVILTTNSNGCWHVMNNSFLQGRIDVTKAQIVAYEDALTALAAGVQSYTLDTGQSKQTVTKFDLGKLNEIVESLYNRCATLEARLNGSGTTHSRGSW